MKRIIQTFFVCLSFLFITTVTLAQGPPQPPGPGEEDDQPVPVGSGMVILALLGVALGLYLIRFNNDKHTLQEKVLLR